MISDLLPALERAGTVTLDGALAERIIRRELKVRAYFDRENNLVLCRVAFLYGDTEIDPFAPQAAPVEGDERIMLLRDAAAERRALDLLAAFGFRMQKGRVILGGQEPIYRFLTEGIYRMQENAEVYCSDEFRKMTPRKPHFVGTLRMQDGALRLEMTENGEPAPEVVDILARAARPQEVFPPQGRLVPRPFGDGRVARDGGSRRRRRDGRAGGRGKERARRDGNRHLPRGVHDQPAGKRRYSRQG